MITAGLRSLLRDLQLSGENIQILHHQQQLWFVSETPGCSSRLWLLWQNLIPTDRQFHSFLRPDNGSIRIHTAYTKRPECGHLCAPSEQHLCYTLCQACSNAAAIYTPPDDVYAFLWLSATFYLSATTIYQMQHSPHICLACRCCHLLQYRLRFRYIACRCICFAIIVFYSSEIYCPIFTLSTTMRSVLHILRQSMNGLRCFFLLNRTCIVAILALIPVNITCSQVKLTLP